MKKNDMVIIILSQNKQNQADTYSAQIQSPDIPQDREHKKDPVSKTHQASRDLSPAKSSHRHRVDS